MTSTVVIAIVAVIDGTQVDTIIGVGRLELVNNKTGEIAFVVADTWQGQGVGTALMSAIVDAARAVGLRSLVADTLGENSRMRRTLATSGLASTTSFDGSSCHNDLALGGAGTARAA